MHYPAAKELHFSIDKYLDPYIPRNRIDRLPRPLSHFLGYRDAPRQQIGNVPIALWAALGGFCGTAILGGLFMADFIKGAGGPVIVGSYGAAAILEYNAIESPFSQPRNQIGGQCLAALVGVCITKLFALNADFENLRWLAGAFAVGISSAVMTLTGTVHPPAGATALLAAVEPEISGLGWLYLGVILLSSIITNVVACLLNNIQRQYPMYWWSPHEKITTVKSADTETGQKEEKVDATEGQETVVHTHDGPGIHLDSRGITVPEDFYLAYNERSMLKILEERLRETRDEDARDGNTRNESSPDTGTSEHSKSKSLSSQSSLPPINLDARIIYDTDRRPFARTRR